MKLNVAALTVTAGLIWGTAILLVTSVNLAVPAYGRAFLNVVASIYPGYHPGIGLDSVVTGTVYGLADGAIAGALVGWLYNWLARGKRDAVS